MNRHSEIVTAGAASIETYVDGQGPAVVIIPSYGRDSGDDFDLLSAALVDAGYRVLCPQPRGVASSVGPMTGVGFDDMAHDIATVIDTLADGPAVVLGHAFGDFVARATAVHHCDKVSAVILAAASGKTVAPEINSAPMRAGDLPTWPATGAPAARRCPSQDAVRRIRRRLADEIRGMRGSNAVALIARLNPIIRGWAAYYRGVVSSKVFSALDSYVWCLTFRWARRTHPNKPKKWIVRRYFGRFNRFRNDRWVFGARDRVLNDRGDIAFLTKFSWTKIVRHRLVAGGASKDDPDLTRYWAARRRKRLAPLDSYNLRLLVEQDGHCPLCGDYLLTPDQPRQSPHEWERWWLSIVKRAIAADYLTHHGRGGAPDGNRTRLVHNSCHRSLRARRGTRPEPATSSGLA
jgi:pimeloyl-ACP methyl ester carboxylesterase